MAFFNIKERKIGPQPIPPIPPYVPPTPPTPPTPEEGSTPVVPRPSFTGDASINIGVTTDENIVVNKTFSNTYSCDISIKEAIDLLNPRIILETSTDLRNCNYMEAFNRYYFIVSIRMLTGGLWEIIAREDVLKTYADAIKGHSAVIARNANRYNKYLNDKSFKTYSYKNTRTLKFPSGFSKTLKWVLVTLGSERSE